MDAKHSIDFSSSCVIVRCVLYSAPHRPSRVKVSRAVTASRAHSWLVGDQDEVKRRAILGGVRG